LAIAIGGLVKLPAQNVAWKNVEKAIYNLKKAGLLDLESIYNSPLEQIAELIHPSRYYNVKAKKLKAVASHIMENYQADLDRFLQKSLEELRQELLEIWGIGSETADSIILYAAELPSFVVDAYTKRIFQRLGIFPDDINYDEMREYFMKNLPGDIELYNDYHAQIVALGNNICKNKPQCNICPLYDLGKCLKF